jgi:autotransporter adhesin
MGLITRFYGPNKKGSELTIKDMDDNLYFLQSKGVESISYSSNTLTLTNPTGGTLTTTIESSSEFTGNTSGNCITDLYVTNLYGCSPITLNNSVQYKMSSASGEYSHAEGFQTTAGVPPTERNTVLSALTINWFFTKGVYIPYVSDTCNQLSGLTEQIDFTIDCLQENGESTIVNLTLSGGADDETIYTTDYREIFCDDKDVEGLKFFPEKNFVYTGGTGYTTANLEIITVCEKLGVDYCHSEGINTTASGTSSHAEGSGTTASGNASHAEGGETQANGGGSHAEGYLTISSGDFSHAEGRVTQANGTSSHAEGDVTIASGDYSHAEGRGTQSNGNYSHAEGYLTISSGEYSHSEGFQTTSAGEYSHTEGFQTTANVSSSHAEGYLTIANGFYSHAEGRETQANGGGSHAEGYLTIANGDYSHAEGNRSQSFDGGHAEGYQTIASGYSHSEGYLTQALGLSSHAEGNQTQAIGQYSHAEGYQTQAISGSCHAEGLATIASGFVSHSEGYQTTAGGWYSHAGGYNSVASGDTSFIHSKESVVTGDRSVVLGGENITGSKDDMVYVPNLNIVNIISANDDIDAGLSGLTTGDIYQTSGLGASPLNVAGILMIKQ